MGWLISPNACQNLVVRLVVAQLSNDEMECWSIGNGIAI